MSTNLLAPWRVLRIGTNCSPAATAVTLTSPPSTVAVSTLHHWYFGRITWSSKKGDARLAPGFNHKWCKHCSPDDSLPAHFTMSLSSNDDIMAILLAGQ